MWYLPKGCELLFSAIYGGNDQFECFQYHGCGHNLFSSHRFLGFVGTPYVEYFFKSAALKRVVVAKKKCKRPRKIVRLD